MSEQAAQGSAKSVQNDGEALEKSKQNKPEQACGNAVFNRRDTRDIDQDAPSLRISLTHLKSPLLQTHAANAAPQRLVEYPNLVMQKVT